MYEAFELWKRVEGYSGDLSSETEYCGDVQRPKDKVMFGDRWLLEDVIHITIPAENAIVVTTEFCIAAAPGRALSEFRFPMNEAQNASSITPVDYSGITCKPNSEPIAGEPQNQLAAGMKNVWAAARRSHWQGAAVKAAGASALGRHCGGVPRAPMFASCMARHIRVPITLRRSHQLPGGGRESGAGRHLQRGRGAAGVGRRERYWVPINGGRDEGVHQRRIARSHAQCGEDFHAGACTIQRRLGICDWRRQLVRGTLNSISGGRLERSAAGANWQRPRGVPEICWTVNQACKNAPSVSESQRQGR
ncbi:hypothetical protein B0H12DRAFT_1219258 [Mycena haematopus]|nr:hypothetical protein B0H12DRAFT_1219258 [Mycena haematopus]